ncbi:MAG: arabinogalactan endo-1,4-beta-galactosidase, partial [Bacteroidota bacterium]|nr:arabinogalactan endo-1,4-beta-galactosidase [Bacteroidota bacterium]
MKKILPLTLLLALSAGLFCACSEKDDASVAKVTVPAFATGADISWVSEMEKDGKTFKTRAGEKADIFTVLKDTGVDAIRLRVWVDPDGGWSGKEDVVALGKRVSAAGLPLMVDFHYSDFFADPGNQT